MTGNERSWSDNEAWGRDGRVRNLCQRHVVVVVVVLVVVVVVVVVVVLGVVVVVSLPFACMCYYECVWIGTRKSVKWVSTSVL